MTTPLLDTIHTPTDLRALSPDDLPKLAAELRGFLVDSVSRTGGHLASNLGAVELTIALHYVFDFEKDRMLWDVGHQCYPHKQTDHRIHIDSTSTVSGPTWPNGCHVSEVEIDPATGEVLEIGGESLDSAGYDLLALMTGSEGMLGIVTEIVVKLIPLPQKAQLVMSSFDDVHKAAQAVADVIGAGIIPAGMEMMDKITIHAVEEFLHIGYDLNAAAILLCESDGNVEEVADEIACIQRIMKLSGATRISTSQNDLDRLSFWAGRKAAFPAAGRVSPYL